MTNERLLELHRKAYGRGGEHVHDPDLMEACDEINRLWHMIDRVLEGEADVKILRP